MAKSLPRDVLTEILTHAASNSLIDFINTTICCKDFHEASNNNNYIFKNVSMDKHELVPWRKGERTFLKRCKDAKNAEALYRKGMLNCISGRKPKSGLHYLKMAAEKGHHEAMYTYGLILISLGLKTKGLKVVSGLNLSSNNINPAKRSLRIANYRSKTEMFLSNMWVRMALKPPKEFVNNANASNCTCDGIGQRLDSSSLENNAWEARNNFASHLHCCDSCFWDNEATFFNDMLREYLVNI